MKTRVISALGMLAMGALAVGCSAEQGSGEPAVGQKTVALTALTAARDHAAGCVLGDYMLIAGGEDSTGAVSATAYLYDIAGDSWTTLGVGLNTARTRAIGVKVPGDDKCVIIGGETTVGGNGFNKSQTFDLSDYIGNIDDGDGRGWTAETTMQEGRTRFQAAPCGTSKIIALGGKNAAGTATNKAEVYSAGTWSTIDLDLVTGGVQSTFAGGARKEFGLGVSTDNRKFLLAGGSDGSAPLNTVATISVDTSCAADQSSKSPGTTLGSARLNPVAFPEGSTDTFLVAGGQDDSMSPVDLYSTDKIQVTSWSTGAITRSAGDDMPSSAGRRESMLAKFGAVKYAVIGGINGSSSSNVIDVWDTFTKEWASVNTTLDTARYGAVVDYSSSADMVLVVGGFGTDELSSVEGLP